MPCKACFPPSGAEFMLPRLPLGQRRRKKKFASLRLAGTGSGGEVVAGWRATFGSRRTAGPCSCRGACRRSLRRRKRSQRPARRDAAVMKAAMMLSLRAISAWRSVFVFVARFGIGCLLLGRRPVSTSAVAASATRPRTLEGSAVSRAAVAPPMPAKVMTAAGKDADAPVKAMPCRPSRTSTSCSLAASPWRARRRAAT